MEALKLEQSLPLCCSLAAIGGALEVAATAITAIPAVREKQGCVLSKWMQLLSIIGNVALQGIGSIFGHLVATWFGPVSMVVPFFFSATLLCNMLVVGILGEEFTKNMRVGTVVIVLAVMLLPIVGPTAQEDQSIESLMGHWYSLTWFGILVILSFGTGTIVSIGITQYSQRNRMVILLCARASSLCLNLTVSRAFILGPSGVIFTMLIVLKFVSGSIYTTAIVVQSYTVEQSKFVPLNATLIILVNALTGLIIWEDWRVVQSWIGTIVSFSLLGIGCDLLLTVPLLNSENTEFGVSKRVSLIQPELKRMSMLMTGRRPVGPLIEFDYDDDKEEAEKLATEDVEGNNNQIDESERLDSVTAIHHKADQRKSLVNAWKEVMNLTAAGLNDVSDDESSVDRAHSHPPSFTNVEVKFPTRNPTSDVGLQSRIEAQERTSLFGPRLEYHTNGK
jgi:hypothetical protein